MALRPDARNVGSKSRSREPHTSHPQQKDGIAGRIPASGTTLSAGKISRQPPAATTTIQPNDSTINNSMQQTANNSSVGLNFHSLNQEY